LKVEQWKTVEKLIQETIPIKQSKINQYKIVFGDRTRFVPNAETGRRVTAQIEEFLTRP
jgi:hypothetical protein